MSRAAGVDGYSSGSSTRQGWITQTEYTLNTSDQLNATATTQVTDNSDSSLIKRVIKIDTSGVTGLSTRQNYLSHVWEQFKVQFAIEWLEHENGLGKFLSAKATEQNQWSSSWTSSSAYYKTYYERYHTVKSAAVSQSTQSITDAVGRFLAQATTRVIPARAAGLHSHRDICELLQAVSHTGGSSASTLMPGGAGALTHGIYQSMRASQLSNLGFCSANGAENSNGRQTSSTCASAAFKFHKVISDFMESHDSYNAAPMFHNNNDTFVVGVRRLIPRDGCFSNGERHKYCAGTNVLGQTQTIAHTNAFTRDLADRITSKLKILVSS